MAASTAYRSVDGTSVEPAGSARPCGNDAELRAGELIRVLTDELGLSVDEVVAVLDSRVGAREVRRLRRLARERSGSSS